MAIKHAAVKVSGDRGYASEWNEDHVVDDASKPKNSTTLIVAASNSLDTTRADYVCDGVDDQDEINQAISDLPAGGGRISLLEGQFDLSGAVIINKGGVALVGQGPATILRVGDGADCNAVELGTGAGAFTNILVADLLVDGNKTNQTINKTGILITGLVTDSAVAGCWVINVKRDGIYVTTTADRNLITECNVTGCTRDGILVWGSTRGNIVSNNVSYSNTRNGIWVGTGSNLVEGNLCYSNGPDASNLGSGIHIEFSGNLVVGNHTYSNYYAEIVVWVGTKYNTVTGNYCVSGRGNGISVFGANNTVTGNSVYGCDYRGIFVGADYNTITGNVVLDNGQLGAGNVYSGIDLDDADYNIVTGNQCNDDRGASAEQRYGITETDTSDWNLIIGNVCVGNKTGKINVLGGNTVNVHNL